jgi:hypothetical protein
MYKGIFHKPLSLSTYNNPKAPPYKYCFRACLNFAFGSENCQFLVLTKEIIAEYAGARSQRYFAIISCRLRAPDQIQKMAICMLVRHSDKVQSLNMLLQARKLQQTAILYFVMKEALNTSYPVTPHPRPFSSKEKGDFYLREREFEIKI